MNSSEVRVDGEDDDDDDDDDDDGDNNPIFEKDEGEEGVGVGAARTAVTADAATTDANHNTYHGNLCIPIEIGKQGSTIVSPRLESSTTNKSLLLFELPPPPPPPSSNVVTTSTTTTTTTSTTTSTSTTTTSSRASSRKNRVYVFRQFLLDTYGDSVFSSSEDDDDDDNNNTKKHDNKKKNVTVLDVAGGKGDLSWLLVNADGLDSVVADPRDTTHRHLIQSVRYLRRYPEEAQRRSLPNRPSHQPLASLLPMLLRTRMTNDARRTDQHHQDGHDHDHHDNDHDHDDIRFDSPRHLKIHVDQNLVRVVRQIIHPSRQIDDHNNNHDDDDSQHDDSEDQEEEDEDDKGVPRIWKTYWKEARSRADYSWLLSSTTRGKSRGKKKKMQQIDGHDENGNNNNNNHDDDENGDNKKKDEKNDKNDDDDDDDDDGGRRIVTARESLQMMRSIRLIIGFHPDQATEAALDLAIALRIPFCIVPCCVFPSEFPDRRLPHRDDDDDDDDDNHGHNSSKNNSRHDAKYHNPSRRVRYYHEFMEYLATKHSDRVSIRRATLRFFHHETTEKKTSRNGVLYTLPEDHK